MRWEEIAHRLSTALMVQDFRAIVDEIRNHVAERALPVTRERCEAMGFERMVDEEAYPNREIWKMPNGDGISTMIEFTETGCQWFGVVLETIGQLLDLLSGLGVRK